MEALLNSGQSKVWVINEQFINLSWRFSVPPSKQLCKEKKQNLMAFDYFILIGKILFKNKVWVKVYTIVNKLNSTV